MSVTIGKFRIELVKEGSVWIIYLHYEGKYWDEIECTRMGCLDILARIQGYQLRKVAS